MEFMKRLVEIRNQEFLCRERALLDSDRKIFWLAKRKNGNGARLTKLRSTSGNATSMSPSPSRVPISMQML
jgi:hypothetical protein